MKITKANINDVFKSKYQDKEYLERIKGLTCIDEIFFDNSGLSSERGLITAGINKIESILKDNPTIYTYLTSVGQFQVYVGIFIKTNKLAKV